jgi:tRNA(fMet)-specific endonuclease VapC
VTYLLDTNSCIALMNDRQPNVRKRFEETLQRGHTLAVSAIVTFELWYGAEKSVRREFNRERLETFLTANFLSLAFEDEDARVAGAVRAALQAAGTPIGAYDLLIAGQALRRDLTLVTANVAEFARVRDLRWEDWAREKFP